MLTVLTVCSLAMVAISLGAHAIIPVYMDGVAFDALQALTQSQNIQIARAFNGATVFLVAVTVATNLAWIGGMWWLELRFGVFAGSATQGRATNG